MSNVSKQQVDRRAVLQQALVRIEELQAKLGAIERSRREPLAIIGIGCRFPGDANSPEAFWHLLRDGVDAITDVPPDRWDMHAYYDPDRHAPGKTYSRWGGYVKDIDRFDPHFFGISPREAVSMDPQQRLFLEVAWEALENAGIAPDTLHGSQTGVFVGVTTTEYLQLHEKYIDPMHIDAYRMSGNVLNVISGRVSYILGLQGPAISVDTACSSSLTAVHLACQSLRTGECDMALAGGVNVILLPETHICFSKWGMFSPDGRCRTFDAAAAGFVRSEGSGVVVLKRLADAIAHGDTILALIRGTAANQDGPSSGLSVPSGLAQQHVMRQALENAGVKPEQVGYVETHGTGTTLGDPIEVEALGAVYGQGRSHQEPLAIGAVKTNLGHAESASGIAGLIKTVLALQYEEIPPHLHLQKLSPHMPWAKLPIVVPTERTPWPRGQKSRMAGVSGFGFSGTNVHVIVDEAPDQARRIQGQERTAHLFTLSAKDANALKELAGRYVKHLATHADLSLPDVCHTANTGRAHYAHRLAVVSNSLTQLRRGLADVVEGREAPGIVAGEATGSKRSKVAFLYAGQGYQYAGMGRQLFDTQPTFRKALEHCDALFQPHLKLSLLSILYPDCASTTTRNPTLIDQTFYTQPAMFALQYALTELWRSWGITPDVVMGHSLGEFMAAYVAGVYSLEDGVKLVAERGRVTQDVPTLGMMVSLQASEARVAQMLAAYDGEVCIAAINGPESTVISGSKESMTALLKTCEVEGVKPRPLAISNAFHSPCIEPALDSFTRVASEVIFRPPHLRLISTLTGNIMLGDEIPDATYWRRHLREPVQFYAAMRTLHAQGYEHFIEIGPHPTLLGMGRQCVPEEFGGWFPSLRIGREDWQQMLESLGGLYVRGIEVDWRGFDRDYVRRRLWLPTYPFQRKRYWIEEKKSPASLTAFRPMGRHPLLGQYVRSPLVKDMIFESQLHTDALPYLVDHQVHGLIVLPAAAHLEMVVAAAHTAFGNATHVFEDIVLREPLILSEGEGRMVQLVITPREDGTATCKLISLLTKHRDAEDAWKLHVTGSITMAEGRGISSAGKQLALDDVRMRCQEEIPVSDYYAQLRARGLQFGARFQGIERLWRRDGESLGQIQLPLEFHPEAGQYHLHPVLLDACLQTFVAAWPLHGAQASADATYLPLSLERYRLSKRPTVQLWSNVLLRTGERTHSQTYTGDICIYDRDGDLVAEIQGLLVKRTSAAVLRSAKHEDITEWLYDIAWRPQKLVGPTSESVAPDSMPAPIELAKRAHSRVSQLQAGLLAHEAVMPSIEALSSAYIVQALYKLGWTPHLHMRVSFDTMVQQLHVVDAHHRLLNRMLHILAEDGVLRKVDGVWEVCRIPEGIDPQPRWQALWEAYPASAAELTLLGRCGPQLSQVLRGDCDPLQLLFPDGSLALLEQVYQHSSMTQALNTMVAEVMDDVIAALPRERTIRILEVGAGTGGTTAYVLPKLQADRTEYVFTDVSPFFLTKAEMKFRDSPFVRYQLLDIEGDPAAQGFTSQAFDVVIAANVLHATSNLRQAVQHVRQLLAPKGLMILLEGTAPQRWVDLTFGLTEGWWKFADVELRPSYALLSKQKWMALLAELQFTDAQTVPSVDDTTRNGQVFAHHAMVLAHNPGVAQPDKMTTADLPTAPANQWLIFADQEGVGQKLAHLLRSHGQNCMLVSSGKAYDVSDESHVSIDPQHPEDFVRLFREVFGHGRPTCGGVVHLWALDTPTQDGLTLDDLHRAQITGSASVLHLVQAMITEPGAAASRLWLVTRGAQAIGSGAPVEVIQAPMWGLGKVIALEHPELQCVRVDLDPVRRDDAAHVLFEEVCARATEDHIAFRDRERYVARLIRNTSRTRTAASEMPSAEVRPEQLQSTTPGVLDGLAFRPVERRRPGGGEVEIRVHVSGLNFRDVLNALGMYPGEAGPLGGECAGTIVAIGDGVEDLRVGDHVIALAPGSFSTFVTTCADLVVMKPEPLSFEEAATIPSAFMTAHYTLLRLGKLSAGDKVLIHAAAGGVGMAAVQLAQRVGAEIFVTAGSAEKRAFLTSLGVHHVMDSRSLDFVQDVMRLTAGQGVDVVLNSLSGDFIPASLSVLKDGGRFLEIGKRDIWHRERVDQFKRVGAYHIVDLAAAVQDDPALIHSLLHEVMQGVKDGGLKPLPLRVFPRQDVVRAFRYMQQAKHIGKIVVTQQTTPVMSHSFTLKQDATYLITGGLAGLGLLTAQWMVGRGARHLVLLGRSDPSPAARDTIAQLEETGGNVRIVQGDVSQEHDVIRVLAEIRDAMPPLRGIIHSAGVLDDGALVQQTWERFVKVMAPKVDGAWLLHQHTQDIPLDFFVLYSSVASLLGSAGQGNHAAANAFLDALAHQRQSQGRTGLSIHWGAWSEIGAAAERYVVQQVTVQGIGGIAPQQGLQVLEHVMQQDLVEVGVSPINWSTFLQQWHAQPSFLAEMTHDEPVNMDVKPAPGSPPDLQKQLDNVPPSERRKYVQDYVQQQAIRVLGLEAGQSLDKAQPLHDFGLDSLMAVELRNLIGSGLGVKRTLPATLLFDYPSIAAVTDYLTQEVLSLDMHTETHSENSKHAAAITELEQLSDEEADALLLEELAITKNKSWSN